MKKVVLISGGSDGLGKAIARYLVNDYQVVILSPSKDRLEKLAKEVGVDCFVADVSDYKDLGKAVGEVLVKHKRIDCLINNAGLWIEGELEKNNAERIVKVVGVNLTGVINFTKVVVPQMKKQKEGLIININSQAGFYGKAERSVYNATKWGVTGFTKSIQPELAKYGISVVGVYSGKMDTEMFEKMGIKKDMSDALDTKEVARVVKFLLETGRDVNFPEIGIKNMNS